MKRSILSWLTIVLLLSGVSVAYGADIQIPGWLSGGNGTTDENTLRVTISSDSTGLISIDSITTSIVPGTGATNLGKAEDAAHTTGETGVFMLAVRNDAINTTFTANNNDYNPIAVSRTGTVFQVQVVEPFTSSGLQLGTTEDTASSAFHAGMKIFLIRDDVLEANAATGADGDYTFFRADNFGALWMTPTDASGAAIDMSALAVVGGGVEATALRVTIASDSTGVVSVDDNSGSLTIDAPVGTPVAVRLSDGTGFIDAAVLGTNTYTEATTTGNVMAAVRNDTLAALADTDNELAPLQVNASGGLYIAGSQVVDSAGGSTDAGLAMLALRDDTLTTLTPVDGDYVRLRVDSTGALHVTGGGGGTQFDVDSVAGATDAGTLGLYVRDDALATLTPVDGDYTQGRVDSEGALWIAGSKVEDVAHVTADRGVFMLGVRNEGNGTFSGGSSDYTPIAVSREGFTMNVPSFAANGLSQATQIPKREDQASAGQDALMAITVIRDDALEANAAVSADGDYTWIRVDNFGALWMTPTDASGAAIDMSALAVVGGGVEATALRVTIASDSTGVVSIDDNSGSITIDAPVGTPVAVRLSDGTGFIDAAVLGTNTYTEATTTGNVVAAVRNDVLAALADTDNELAPLQVNATGALYTREHNAVQELAITELIGINEQVDASDYGASVATTLSASGEITKVCLVATEDGSGTVLTPSGTLILFDADPAIAAGDVSITNAERLTIVAQLTFSSTDYQSDVNGASNCQSTTEVFHASALFATWFLASGQTSFNDAGGDDEQLELNIWYTEHSN